MQRGGTVYIIASANRRVLYVGMTSNLYNRIWEHRNKHYPTCFTAKYNCVVLVYHVSFTRIEEAIAEEKRIKDRKRAYKETLIEQMNPEWKDLWDTIQG